MKFLLMSFSKKNSQYNMYIDQNIFLLGSRQLSSFFINLIRIKKIFCVRNVDGKKSCTVKLILYVVLCLPLAKVWSAFFINFRLKNILCKQVCFWKKLYHGIKSISYSVFVFRQVTARWDAGIAATTHATGARTVPRPGHHRPAALTQLEPGSAEHWYGTHELLPDKVWKLYSL